MVVVQAGAVLITEGQVLLKHSPPDIWTLPKGSVESGESPVAAARRELLEETGIKGTVHRFLCRFTFERRGKLFDLRLYLFTFEKKTKAAEQHLGFDAYWIPVEEALRCLSFHQYREALKSAINKPSQHAAEDFPKEVSATVGRLLGRSVKLDLLSREWAARPSFRIQGEALKVRLFSSECEARQTELILNLSYALPTPNVVAREGPLLITDWLEGRPVVDLQMPRTLLLEKAGILLARLHSLSVPQSEAEPAAREAYSYISKRYKESMEIILEAGLVDARDADNLLNILETLMPQKVEAVPVHWDFVLNNLLWHEGELALIDFESSRLFPAGYDLSKSCNLVPRDIHERKAFLRGYASVRSLEPWQTYLGLYDRFFILRNLANRVKKRPHLGLSQPLDALAPLLQGKNHSQTPICRVKQSKTARLNWKERGTPSLPGMVTLKKIERSQGSATGRLIHGECLEVMYALKRESAKSVDLIYFDPPFGSGLDLSMNVKNASSGEVEQIPTYRDTWPGGLDSYLQWCESRLQASLGLLSSKGWLFVHTGYNLGAYLRIILDELLGINHLAGEIIWHYHWGPPSTDRWPKRHGTILAYRMSDSATFCPSGYEDVWKVSVAPEEERTGYDTQKPVELLSRIITECTCSGDLILDPFAGSGTALLAAERLNRSWIGIDHGLPALLCTRKRLRSAGAVFEVSRAFNANGLSTSGLPLDVRIDRRASNVRVLLAEPEGIEYWGIDWNYQALFEECWHSFRTRLEPQLASCSPWIDCTKVGSKLAVRGFDANGLEYFATLAIRGE